MGVSGSSIVSFGKYKGREFQEVWSEDPSYCQWVLKQQDSKSPEEDRPSESMQAFLDYVRQAGKAGKPGKAGKANKPDWPRSQTYARSESGLEQDSPLVSGKWSVRFGAKYAGRSFEEVYAADKKYCDYMTSQLLNSDKLSSKDVMAFVVYVLHRKAQEQR